MSYYLKRGLQSRLQHLERLLVQAEQDAPYLDMSELADRTMRLLHMAAYIKAQGRDDLASREILQDAARVEALFNTSAAAVALSTKRRKKSAG
jgi:hypothetical protein